MASLNCSNDFFLNQATMANTQSSTLNSFDQTTKTTFLADLFQKPDHVQLIKSVSLSSSNADTAKSCLSSQLPTQDHKLSSRIVQRLSAVSSGLVQPAEVASAKQFTTITAASADGSAAAVAKATTLSAICTSVSSFSSLSINSSSTLSHVTGVASFSAPNVMSNSPFMTNSSLPIVSSLAALVQKCKTCTPKISLSAVNNHSDKTQALSPPSSSTAVAAFVTKPAAFQSKSNEFFLCPNQFDFLTVSRPAASEHKSAAAFSTGLPPTPVVVHPLKRKSDDVDSVSSKRFGSAQQCPQTQSGLSSHIQLDPTADTCFNLSSLRYVFLDDLY